MAGISILISNFLLIIVFLSTLIGFILFLISVSLFLKYKKNKQLDSKKRKAIITLIVSVFFLIPLFITIFSIKIDQSIKDSKDKKILDSIDNKVIVQRDNWKKGFKYNDKYLVPINIFMNNENYKSHGAFKNLTKVGALVIKNTNSYYSLYEIDNDSGYKIYYVWVESHKGLDYYSRTFVDKDDYDSVLDYYNNSNIKISALWHSAPKDTKLNNVWKKLDLDISGNRSEIIELSHEVLDDVSNKKIVSTYCIDGYDCISFKIKSDDGVFMIELVLHTKDDELILYLNGYNVEEDIINKHRKMLLNLIDSSKQELLQK